MTSTPNRGRRAVRRWLRDVRLRLCALGCLALAAGACTRSDASTEPSYITVAIRASPVNFDPSATLLYPISAPAEYAGELAEALGPYYTTGMVEDHGGLNNGRFGEAAYLDQCAQVLAERERMLQHELARQRPL